MTDNLWVWVLAAYVAGVIMMAGGLVRRFRTDPQMRRRLDEDPGFTKAMSVLIVLFWPGALVAMPVTRLVNRW